MQMRVSQQAVPAKTSRVIARELCVILVFCLLIMSFMRSALKSIYITQESVIYINLASQIVLYILLTMLTKRYLACSDVSMSCIFSRVDYKSISFALILGVFLFLFSHGQDGVEAWLITKFNPDFGYSLWPFPEGSVAIWTKISPSFILHLIIGIVIAPVVEEVFSRVLLFKNFARHMGVHKAALLNGAIFILMHLKHPHIVSTFIFAVALCYLYVATSSVFLCAIAHSIFNLIAIVTENFFLEHMIHSQDEIGSMYNWRFEFVCWMTSIIFMTFAFYRFRSHLRV